MSRTPGWVGWALGGAQGGSRPSERGRAEADGGCTDELEKEWGGSRGRALLQRCPYHLDDSMIPPRLPGPPPRDPAFRFARYLLLQYSRLEPVVVLVPIKIPCFAYPTLGGLAPPPQPGATRRNAHHASPPQAPRACMRCVLTSSTPHHCGSSTCLHVTAQLRDALVFRRTRPNLMPTYKK